MHAVIAGIVEIDADRLLDNGHGCLVLTAIPDIEDVLTGEVFFEEAAVDAPLIAACRLRPDVPHRMPRILAGASSAVASMPQTLLVGSVGSHTVELAKRGCDLKGSAQSKQRRQLLWFTRDRSRIQHRECAPQRR